MCSKLYEKETITCDYINFCSPMVNRNNRISSVFKISLHLIPFQDFILNSHDYNNYYLYFNSSVRLSHSGIVFDNCQKLLNRNQCWNLNNEKRWYITEFSPNRLHSHIFFRHAYILWTTVVILQILIPVLLIPQYSIFLYRKKKMENYH